MDSLLARRITLTLTLLVTFTAYAQQSAIDANQLVREAVTNELRSSHQGRLFMYKHTETSKKGSFTKEVIQTPEGPLSREIAINGQPLTLAQRATEDARLRKFANDPEARRKKQQSDKTEGQREDLMVKTLPDAFVYTFAGTVRDTNGREVVHLQFRPNLNFVAPNHETQVYVGMQGDMFVDPAAKRIAKIDGTLFKDVNFGWGILGKLDKGGKFIIEQADVGDGVWDTVGQTLRFTGKILLVKPLDVESRETMSNFRQVPSQLTTAQALDLLQKADDVIAENGGGGKEPEKHK